MTAVKAEGGWTHCRGILSGQITRACLDNGMSGPDACETAAVVLTVLDSGWVVTPATGPRHSRPYSEVHERTVPLFARTERHADRSGRTGVQ